MRFNPKLFGCDDANSRHAMSREMGQWVGFPSLSYQPKHELNDDLLTLAEQLSDDAARLAVSYPASRSNVWRRCCASRPASLAARKMAGSWYWSAAAIVLVALGVGAGVLWMGSGRSATVDGLFVPRQLAGPLQPRPAAPVPPEAEPSPLVPVGLFQTLSGPEQEALLDLMESEGYGQQSLSI